MSNPKNVVDYDVRVRERNLKSGVLSKEQVDSYVASLPDVAALAQPVDITQPGTPAPEQPEHAPAEVEAPKADSV
jgi:hypothetical protein